MRKQTSLIPYRFALTLSAPRLTCAHHVSAPFFDELFATNDLQKDSEGRGAERER
jgi:hypothetical protein